MTFMKSLYTGVATTALTLAALPVAAHEDMQIVASFSILGDMVEEVVGDLADVTTIVGPDADAHVYQPSVADARAVAEADVIFVNGLGFETWSDTLISESGTEADVFVATKGITPVKVEGEIDPHAWNSLTNGVVYVNNIADAMKAALPDHADEISANAASYIAKLETLDATTKTKLAKLPSDRRTVVTAHDAFGYLADAYGMTFLAPVGIDTEAEPSARDLAVLIDQLKSDGAAALFVENITSPALVKQISDETGIEVGGRLFSDALSERGGPATSYLAMFEHNLGTLLHALDHKHTH
ncbi:metal ABC transporter substrate-binding protein [Epibacterium sp. SM1969]|uniref:Metal ABC transporter substrate-binding protein n=1 Tax=Tritonibacter aquimaris TaxID=2663379 RepID=A0A844AXK4_9RHOB|nr:zinc ABC transporter substrate-binding protein [Tritonibacter aquimaris]MQY42642.1 metal ABC transporter substrate-binding protein [Tritonibacter aquimaris]